MGNQKLPRMPMRFFCKNQNGKFFIYGTGKGVDSWRSITDIQIIIDGYLLSHRNKKINLHVCMCDNDSESLQLLMGAVNHLDNLLDQAKLRCVIYWESCKQNILTEPILNDLIQNHVAIDSIINDSSLPNCQLVGGPIW